MGKSPYTVGEKQVERQAPEYNSQLSQTPFGFKGPGTSSQRPMNVNFNIKGENPYAVPKGQAAVQAVPNHTYNYKTGEQEYSGPINAERPNPSTGRDEYFVTQPPSPDYFFSEETGSRGYDPEKGFYAAGGQAGRLVAKQGNGLFGDVNNMAGASGLISIMNAASALKNNSEINENLTLGDSVNRVKMDSVDRDPLQQGLWGTGPLTGEEVPNLQPFNQGYRWSQGQGNGLMDQNQLSRYGGNTYQEGGVYELDQNEVDEIMRNGGSIEYFD
jgi:hypothetical protein